MKENNQPLHTLNKKLSELPPQIKNGVKLAGLFLLACTGWFLLLYTAVFLLPLTLAFLISQILEPLVKLLMRKLRMKRGTAANIVGLGALIVLGLLSFVIIANLVSQATNLVENLPNIYASAQVYVTNAMQSLETSIDLIDPAVAGSLQSVLDSITGMLVSGAKTLTFNVLSYATSLPMWIIYIVIFCVSTILMMRERDVISAFFKRQFPMAWVDRFISVRGDLIFALIGYIKAQLILMSVVFFEIFMGFSLMNIRYSLLFAIIIAAFDALPVFGAGLFLIPATLINLVLGNFTIAIGCALLYVLTIVIRQMLEPRLVSVQIGLNPLLTICSMYAGLRIAGFIGLILSTVSVLVIKNFMTAILDGRTVKEYLAGAPAGSNAVDSEPEAEKSDREES